MSFFASYIQERTNDSILETDDGFATYRYINEGKTLYIIDIYIKPEARQKHKAAEIADMIVKEAKEKGCKDMIGTIDPLAKGSTVSLKVLLGYGMELSNVAANLIVFRKEI
jgi:predicted acetyltransferase